MPVESSYRRKPQRSHIAELRRIDLVLERYYENNGRTRGEYLNRHGVGHFLEYVRTEQLDDEYNGPIDSELGNSVDPRESAYGWMCKHFDFPVPAGVHLPRVDGVRPSFCFYVLQYCWKYNRAPTAKYIREYIVPKLAPNHSHSHGHDHANTRHHSNFRRTDREQRERERPSRHTDQRSPATSPNAQTPNSPPKAYERPRSPPPGPTTLATPKSPSLPIITVPRGPVEGHPSHDFILRRGRVRILSKRQFVPAHAPRAHLNIFTSKEVIAELLPRVAEPFPNESSLYYYTDITSALQMNDGEVAEYTLKRIDTDETDGDAEKSSEKENANSKEISPSANSKVERVCFINYDLHLKDGGAALFGVVVPNEREYAPGRRPTDNNVNKWRWQLAAVLSAEQIGEHYEVTNVNKATTFHPRFGHHINPHPFQRALTLPSSSRRSPSFVRQLSQRLVIRGELMRTTDWFAVQQIKSLQRASAAARRARQERPGEPVSVRCSLSRAQWVDACTASFSSSTAPLIPCVLAKNHSHWIEWVKLVELTSVGLFVGVSLKLECGHNGNRWSVQSLLLDPGDIRNKHRLTGLRDGRYIAQMSTFTVSLVELVFTDNHKQSTEKKLRDTKLQIKAQQDSIVRLKERLLHEQRQPRTARPNHSLQMRNGFNLQCGTSQIDELVLCGDDALESVDHKEDHDLALIIDAVLKDEAATAAESASTGSTGSNSAETPEIGLTANATEMETAEMATAKEKLNATLKAQRTYAVLPFDFSQFAERRPLGAKGNIIIDVAMVLSWLPRLPRFASEASLYYWLDLTVALQMSQGFAVQFVARGDGKFLAALLNFELTVGGQDLFGVVATNDKNAAKDGHPFKLVALMTAEEIRTSFGFLSGDLPAHSRRNSAFRSWLRLPRSIAEHDLVRTPINAHCLKVLAPQNANSSLQNLSRQKVDVLLSVDVLRRYIENEVEKVRANAKGKRLVPILCVDKMRGDLHMEWVLLVELLAEGRSVGVAFNYNRSRDAFVAKAVYLDRDEIERKHLLVGLKHNLCTKYLPRMPPFNVGCLRVVPGNAPSHQFTPAANANLLRQQNEALKFQLSQMQQQMAQMNQANMNMNQQQQMAQQNQNQQNGRPHTMNQQQSKQQHQKQANMMNQQNQANVNMNQQQQMFLQHDSSAARVYIAKDITRDILDSRKLLEENTLSTTARLFQYLNWTIRLSKVVGFAQTLESRDGHRALIINSELHCRSTREVLFMLCVPNDFEATKSQKWQMTGLVTARDIFRFARYGRGQSLPRGVRAESPQFASYRGNNRPSKAGLLSAKIAHWQYAQLKGVQTQKNRENEKTARKVLSLTASEVRHAVNNALQSKDPRNALISIVSIVSGKHEEHPRGHVSVDAVLPVQVPVDRVGDERDWIGVVFRHGLPRTTLIDAYDICNKAILCSPSFDAQSLDFFVCRYTKVRIEPSKVRDNGSLSTPSTSQTISCNNLVSSLATIDSECHGNGDGGDGDGEGGAECEGEGSADVGGAVF